MASVNDMIEIHRQLLVDAAEVCRSLPAEIETFAAAVSSLPQEMVKLRLTLIHNMIILGKGFIFVQAGHGMLSIRWSELDFWEGQEVSSGSEGGVFIAPEVVVDKVKELLSQVDRGELVAAVYWLSHYGEVNMDGLNMLGWTASHEEKDAGKLDMTTERKEIGRLPVRGESSAYVVSLTGQRPKSVGNVQPHTEMFRGFSRFLLLTRGNLRRMLITQLIRIKSLFSYIFPNTLHS
jgi:hypothetical protein